MGSYKDQRILNKETVQIMMQNHIGDISLNPEDGIMIQPLVAILMGSWTKVLNGVWPH